MSSARRASRPSTSARAASLIRGRVSLPFENATNTAEFQTSVEERLEPRWRLGMW